jgi:uncharacterized protein
MTPHDVFDRALDRLLAGDMSGFADLWAPDGVMEFPFAPPGWPTRLDGREAVRGYLRGYPAVYTVTEVIERTVHETTDPEVIVVEFAVAGLLVRTGGRYRRPYICVLTVRDGRIARYRDYWSPAGMTADTDFTGRDDA